MIVQVTLLYYSACEQAFQSSYIVWSHIQATHDRRHERVGWRKKRGLYFLLPHTCSLRSPHKIESLLEGCFHKVSAVGSLKASIRTQISTYLCINFYGWTWERILPTLGALRDDTKMAERETSIRCTSQPHNSESRLQTRKIPGSRDSNRENPGSRIPKNLLGTLHTAERVTQKK